MALWARNFCNSTLALSRNRSSSSFALRLLASSRAIVLRHERSSPNTHARPSPGGGILGSAPVPACVSVDGSMLIAGRVRWREEAGAHPRGDAFGCGRLGGLRSGLRGPAVHGHPRAQGVGRAGQVAGGLRPRERDRGLPPAQDAESSHDGLALDNSRDCVNYHKLLTLDMTDKIREYLAEIGRRGGQKSRRTLDPETARSMVRVREARRAYRRFRTSCFWSYRPDLHIGLDDVDWVAETLMKNGNREAWQVGRSLCL